MLRGTAYALLQEAQAHMVHSDIDGAHGCIEAVKMELTHGEDVSMTIVDKHPLTIELSYGVLERLQWLASRSEAVEDQAVARAIYGLLASVDTHATELEGS